MRTGFEKSPYSGPGNGVWFAAAVVLGALWGFSVEPVALPDGALAASGLKFYGWALVGVLILCLCLMGWMWRGQTSDTLYQADYLKSGPLTVMAMPARRPASPPDSAQPEPVAQSENPPSTEEAVQPAPHDPFLAALDYLGHAHATVRIGGILALERMVRQGGDRQSCVGTLAAYIQQWADAGTDRQRPGFDVAAALAVLTRLLPNGDALRNLADLRRTNLSGLELTDADMSQFHFEHANLSGADLRGVNFCGVNFRGADLRGAQLAGAVFAGASLRGADLTGAVLSDDEFGAADLSMAGNISAAQLLHIRYLPARPPRLPAGMQLTNQTAAVAV